LKQKRDSPSFPAEYDPYPCPIGMHSPNPKWLIQTYQSEPCKCCGSCMSSKSSVESLVMMVFL
jgi:hypothetical protein